MDSTHVTVDGGDSTYATTRYAWHPSLNLPTAIFTPEGPYTQFEYNGNGTVAWQQDGRGAGSRTSFRYTASGQLRAVVHPGGAKDSLEFDGTRENVARTLSPLGRWTRYETDRIGRVTVTRTRINMTDTVTQNDSVRYDRMGRVVRSVAYGPETATDSLLLVVTHVYDAGGNVLTTTRTALPRCATVCLPPITHTWRYDGAGRVRAAVAPDGYKDSTEYNHAGLPILQLSRRGDRDSLFYDAAGNLTRRVGVAAVDTAFRLGAAAINPGDANNPAYGAYAIPLDTARFTYDVAGRLIAAVNADARIAREYAPWGGLIRDSLYIARWARDSFHAYGIKYHYDRNGRTTRIDYPSQLVAGTVGRALYAYDSASGLLQQVQGLQDEVHAFTWDTRNRLTQVAMPDSVVETNTYDADGLRSTHKIRNATPGGLPYRYGGTWIEQTSMTYDGRGLLLTSVNTDGTEEERTVSYDGLGQMYEHAFSATGESVFGLPVYAQTSELYRRDAIGNTVFAVVGQAASASGPFGDDTHIFSSIPRIFAYDTVTGRILGQESFSSGSRKTVQRFVYDRQGNTTLSMSDNLHNSGNGERRWDDRVAYYDAAGRVRHAENRSWRRGPAPEYTIDAEFHRQRETYRYD
ncbi:MAG TPA: hypothetical protein PK788_09460, partial [Gemmatimonadaceae bacterium]|nr:hypothetical protein [Gemmatimonadaceae bacterium]